MMRLNKIEKLSVLSLLVVFLMVLALVWQVRALKKELAEKSVPVAEAVAVTNPAPFTAVVATNPAPVAVAVAVVVTNPAVAVAEPVVVIRTNWVDRVSPVVNYVFSCSLSDSKNTNDVIKVGPVPIDILELNDTNFYFFVRFNEEERKGVCYYNLLLTDKGWVGQWGQINPAFTGVCRAERRGNVWVVQFKTATGWEISMVEKQE